MSMPPTEGTTEKDRQQYAFEVALGSYILGKQASGALSINLSKIDPDTTRLFFDAGWAWGKDERPEKCPTCFQPTVQEDDSDES